MKILHKPLDFKTYLKAKLMKTGVLWHKDREVDELNRIEHIYGHLILDKSPKAI